MKEDDSYLNLCQNIKTHSLKHLKGQAIINFSIIVVFVVVVIVVVVIMPQIR